MNAHKARRIRAGYDHEVKLKTKDNHLLEAICKNISLSGIYVETKKKLGFREICKVEIILKQASPPIYLSMRGHVARIDENGMGIVFDELELDTYEHLQHLIYYNTEEVDEFVKEMAEKPGIKD